MPLPEFAVERRLGVDLELVDVDGFAQELLNWLNQPRMGAKAAKGVIVGVRSKGGPRRTGFFPPNLLALACTDVIGL
jgi:hypothetical protein